MAEQLLDKMMDVQDRFFRHLVACKAEEAKKNLNFVYRPITRLGSLINGTESVNETQMRLAQGLTEYTAMRDAWLLSSDFSEKKKEKLNLLVFKVFEMQMKDRMFHSHEINNAIYTAHEIKFRAGMTGIGIGGFLGALGVLTSIAYFIRNT